MKQDSSQDKPRFDEPVEYDPFERDYVIYRNKKSVDLLTRKKEEYGRRIREDPANLDATIKLVVVSLLLEQGYVTSTEAMHRLADEAVVADVNEREFRDAFRNALFVVGTYNTGDPERIKSIVRTKPTVDDEREREKGRLRSLVERVDGGGLTPTEEGIGVQIRLLLQTRDDVRCNRYAEPPATLSEIRRDLASYMRERFIESENEAIEKLTHELTGHVFVNGFAVPPEELLYALRRLLSELENE